MTEAGRSDRRTFDEFCDELAAALDVTPDRLRASRSVVADVPLDELSLVTLVLTVQAMNPYFDIPDQMDVNDLSILDLYHFYDVMWQGHIER
jgi:hypothetical protein